MIDKQIFENALVRITNAVEAMTTEEIEEFCKWLQYTEPDGVRNALLHGVIQVRLKRIVRSSQRTVKATKRRYRRV